MDTKILYEYTKSMRVLFVEDDEAIRESMSTLLASYFLELVSAIDGVDALEKLSSSENLFDLVMSDISMPNMDGIEMAKRILLDNPEMPIIFISAHNELEYLRAAIDIGVSSFIPKPIAQDTLHNAIFKASQVISDHKFVLSHMDMIEELNMQLENQNKELQKKNEELEKSLRLLDTMVSKEQVIHSTQDKEPSPVLAISRDEFDVHIEQLVNEDLHELRELHMEIDTSVINIINSHSNEVLEFEVILDKFNKYASILTYHNFFASLSSGMKSFILVLKDNPMPESLEERENIFMLLETFLYVLKKWQNELESGNKEMINFFDASIINDMTTISQMWIKSPDEEEDFGEMEFF